MSQTLGVRLDQKVRQRISVESKTSTVLDAYAVAAEIVEEFGLAKSQMSTVADMLIDEAIRAAMNVEMRTTERSN